MAKNKMICIFFDIMMVIVNDNFTRMVQLLEEDSHRIFKCDALGRTPLQLTVTYSQCQTSKTDEKNQSKDTNFSLKVLCQHQDWSLAAQCDKLNFNLFWYSVSHK